MSEDYEEEEEIPFYLIQDYKDEIADASVFLDESISTVVEAMMRTALEHVEALLPALQQ